MTRFQRLLFWVSTAATTATGVVHFWMKYFLVASDPWAVANHPLQPLMLKLHILTAPIMLFAVGLIWTDHIWRHIRSGLPTGRRTGVLAAAVFGPLVLSGYLIQAVTAPRLLVVITWGHIALGLACGAGVVLHQYAVRRRHRLRKGALPVVATLERPGDRVPTLASRSSTQASVKSRVRRAL